MSSFDKVIGYRSIKRELLQICDMIRNRTIYEEMGARLPHGLLLHGNPGLGKSLLANCFIEECGLNTVTVRRDKGGDAFIDSIAQAFAKAKEEAPSILFLDDMDKFANEDNSRCDAPEYVAVQAGIDDVKETDGFVSCRIPCVAPVGLIGRSGCGRQRQPMPKQLSPTTYQGSGSLMTST